MIKIEEEEEENTSSLTSIVNFQSIEELVLISVSAFVNQVR